MMPAMTRNAAKRSGSSIEQQAEIVPTVSPKRQRRIRSRTLLNQSNTETVNVIENFNADDNQLHDDEVFARQLQEEYSRVERERIEKEEMDFRIAQALQREFTELQQLETANFIAQLQPNPPQPVAPVQVQSHVQSQQIQVQPHNTQQQRPRPQIADPAVIPVQAVNTTNVQRIVNSLEADLNRVIRQANAVVAQIQPVPHRGTMDSPLVIQDSPVIAAANPINQTVRLDPALTNAPVPLVPAANPRPVPIQIPNAQVNQPGPVIVHRPNGTVANANRPVVPVRAANEPITIDRQPPNQAVNLNNRAHQGQTATTSATASTTTTSRTSTTITVLIDTNNVKDNFEYLGSCSYIKHNKTSPEECLICLDDYVNMCQITHLACFHKFHTKCIKEWLNNNNDCPMCKKNALTGE